MLKRWKKLKTRIVYQNPWWTYKLDDFEIPGGYAGEYHYVYTHGASMVIPVTDEKKIVLVNQYRYLCERESLEFPGGSIKDGSAYLETAYQELEEETGYRAGQMTQVGVFNPYNGVTSEICQVFIARDLQRTAAKPDRTEEFEIVSHTPEEIEEMIAGNVIWDGMTLAAWMLARNNLVL